MTTGELRGGEDGASRPSDPTDGIYGDEISLWPLVRTLWSYRRIIIASVSAILLVFLLWGFTTYTFQPVERRASVGFRLLFDGADIGEYPNGLIFSRAEIIGTPVLTEVYEMNELERYFAYESFKNRLFILEANRELELLGFEYQSKLADPAVSAVDRAALETEFLGKRQALQVAQYGLNYINSDTATSIPNVLLNKVLNDVLAVWAEQAATRKRVLTYLVDIFTRNLFDVAFLEGDDYVVRVDILRGKVTRLVNSLTALEDLPGARIIRVGENGISLPEIRGNLEDLMLYRLEPLTRFILSNNLSRDPELLQSYLENRVFQITLDQVAAAARGMVLEESLRGYLAGAVTPASESGVDGGLATGAPLGGLTAVIPQIGDSFLDRIMAMGGETEDVKFRQDLTNRLIAVRQDLVVLDREKGYYDRMQELMRRPSNPPDSGMVDEVESKFTAIYEFVIEAIDQSNAIFVELSAQNLNPRTNLLTITNPFAVTTVRAVTLRTLWPIGLLTLLLGLTVVPLACLIYHYLRRETARAGHQPDVPQQEGPKARVETAGGP